MSMPPDVGPRPRLSVVMATYDGESYLAEMLDSLAAQDVLPDEMVVRDDASSDGTVRVLEDFATRAPFPVRVIAGDVRLGYARNFVTAAGRATGDLLFFADQDDTWRPEKLARMPLRRLLRGVVRNQRLMREAHAHVGAPEGAWS